jgi:hypothetical protein
MYRRITEYPSDTILFVLSLVSIGIGILLFAIIPASAYNTDPTMLILLGIVTIGFIQRFRKVRHERKEMEGLLKWLANAPRTFQDNIQFPLTESNLSPSGKYLASILPEVQAWILYLRTSFPVSASAEVPMPDVPEEKI